ncbi:radical SAM protein [Kineothrix sedimenti]|uniref:Radical SAM protein n=1 Tax=Kineothrix sedimenti TaxID=3123317 RepID=A0ABZ3F015_9FIRM
MTNFYNDFMMMIESKKVICFGAGKSAERIVNEMSLTKDNIEGFVDSNIALWNTTIQIPRVGIFPVYSPQFLEDLNPENYIILITSMYWEEIIKYINNNFNKKYRIFHSPCVREHVLGSKEFMETRYIDPCINRYQRYCKEFLLLNDKEIEMETNNLRQRLIKDDYVVIPRMPIILSTKCTLRCKECNNLVPYFNNPIEFSAEEIIDNITKVAHAADEWIYCELVGGEPFLYKELPKVLNYVLELKKIRAIEVTTNGTVIPSKEVLGLLANEKIIVKISDYGKYSNIPKLTNIFEENHIKYTVYEDMQWIKAGGCDKRNRDLRIQISQYMQCPASHYCHTLMGNKIFICSRAASLYYLEILKEDNEYILIDNNRLKEDIKGLYLKPQCTACDYCDMYIPEQIMISAAEQRK